MRAQRAYKELDVSRDVRPAIRKTNIVVAEPMPGEIELRREFVATLEPKLGQLLERMFDRMELAGEAGSLLRIEDEICNAVQEIHDCRALEATRRWRTAEENLVRVLRAYAEHAMNGRAFQRRLFVEDAVRGLGFIDVCCQRYDTILMNPPFGTFSLGVRDWARNAYPRTKNDIYAAFVERGIELLEKRAFLGAITSRTGFFLSSFQKWREEILLKEAPPVVVADLGYGVMDDAMVEAAAYCLEVAV